MRNPPDPDRYRNPIARYVANWVRDTSPHLSPGQNMVATLAVITGGFFLLGAVVMVVGVLMIALVKVLLVPLIIAAVCYGAWRWYKTRHL